MDECRWIPRVERWFDGESEASAEAERHVRACAVCAAHLEGLESLREGVRTAATRATIGDAQMPAFLRGIRDAIERPSPRHGRRAWVAATVSLAALIVASLAFTLLTGGPQGVRAVEVEHYATELEGATITTYASEDGAATVWVTMPDSEAP